MTAAVLVHPHPGLGGAFAPLFDTPAYVRALERAYSLMQTRYEHGTRASFQVPSGA